MRTSKRSLPQFVRERYSYTISMASATAVAKTLGDPITKSGYTPIYFSFAPGSYMDYTTWWCSASISGDQVNPGSFYGKSSYSSTIDNTFYIDVLWQKVVSN